MKTSLFLLCIYLLINAGCSKSKNPKDNQAPVITLNTPIDNQLFTAGQIISITGTVNDNKTIAELHVHVNNNNTSAILLDTHQYPDSPQANFSESLNAVAGIQYRIEILAIDAEVNESRKVIFVTCN